MPAQSPTMRSPTGVHTPEAKAAHWRRTRSLTMLVLVIWAIFALVIHWFATPLNEITFIGFPLGYYMAAQGSLIVFVVLIFWFAKRQDTIDREAGVAEPD
jgi:putative solute:sodium symporter small subunit